MTRRKAEQIGSVLNVCSFIGGFGLLFLGLFNIPPLEKLFSAIGILCFFAGLFFLLRYPEVFVAEMKKELQKKGLDTKYESRPGHGIQRPGRTLNIKRPLSAVSFLVTNVNFLIVYN